MFLLSPFFSYRANAPRSASPYFRGIATPRFFAVRPSEQTQPSFLNFCFPPLARRQLSDHPLLSLGPKASQYGFRTGFSFSFITILLESFKSVKPLFKIFTMNRTFARYPFKKTDKMLLQKLFISYKKDLCRNNTSLPFLKFAIFKS